MRSWAGGKAGSEAWRSGLSYGLLAVVLVVPLMEGISQVVAPASQAGTGGRPGMGTEPFPSPADPIATPNPHKLEQMREDDRRKRLKADTAKLVELSTALRDEVDKTSKDELSLEVVRKAAEIEKLAHDVRDRMKS